MTFSVNIATGTVSLEISPAEVKEINDDIRAEIKRVFAELRDTVKEHLTPCAVVRPQKEEDPQLSATGSTRIRAPHPPCDARTGICGGYGQPVPVPPCDARTGKLHETDVWCRGWPAQGAPFDEPRGVEGRGRLNEIEVLS